MGEQDLEDGLTSQFGQLEEARQKTVAKKKNIHILFGIIVSVCVVGVFVLTKSFFFPFLVGFLIAALWYFFIDKENKKFGDLFKSLVMIPSLLKRFPKLSYNEKGIEKKAFVASELYKKNDIDRYQSEDMFSGYHGKTKFRFSEVHVQRKKQNSDSGSSYITIFQGVFLIADFNKSLNGTTRVVQAGDNFFKKLINRKKQVSLEHPTFEDLFNTYSDDQIEARYILSTAMMDRILELQAEWKDEIRISFIKDHVFIAVNHKRNLFEPDLKREVDHEQLNRIFDEVSGCLDIMDMLDLNTRIWTKE